MTTRFNLHPTRHPSKSTVRLTKPETEKVVAAAPADQAYDYIRDRVIPTHLGQGSLLLICVVFGFTICGLLALFSLRSSKSILIVHDVLEASSTSIHWRAPNR